MQIPSHIKVRNKERRKKFIFFYFFLAIFKDFSSEEVIECIGNQNLSSPLLLSSFVLHIEQYLVSNDLIVSVENKSKKNEY